MINNKITLPCFGKTEREGKLRCGAYTPEILTGNTDDKSTDGQERLWAAKAIQEVGDRRGYISRGQARGRSPGWIE